jgi:hypothetical protein
MLVCQVLVLVILPQDECELTTRFSPCRRALRRTLGCMASGSGRYTSSAPTGTRPTAFAASCPSCSGARSAILPRTVRDWCVARLAFVAAFLISGAHPGAVGRADLEQPRAVRRLEAGHQDDGSQDHLHARAAVRYPHQRAEDPWQVGPHRQADRHVQVRCAACPSFHDRFGLLTPTTRAATRV